MINTDAMNRFKDSFRRHFCNDPLCETDCVLNRLHRANAEVYTIEQILAGCPYFYKDGKPIVNLERIKRMRIQCPDLLNVSRTKRRRNK